MSVDATQLPQKAREDILVSVGFIEVQPTQDSFAVLKNLSQRLNKHFRYWEILVIADAEEIEGLEPLFDVVPNLRLLQVRGGTSLYRRRIVLASQAIGDVLAITKSSEVVALDLVAMIETSINEASVVIGRRHRGNLLDPMIGALGKAGGFHVSTRDMQTVVYPRSLLDMLAARADRDLALRFAPRDASIKINETLVANEQVLERRGLRDMGRRISLIHKLIVNLAPRVLRFLSILAALVAFVAILFIFYIFGVWAFVDVIQPGWITTSFLLSGTAAFLGLAIFCLASGLQMIIDLLLPDIGRDVIDERSVVELVSNVMTELNVDYDPSGTEVAHPPQKPMSQAR